MDLAVGRYRVREDFGEGETDTEWQVAHWDGRNWWSTEVPEPELLYVAEIGVKV